MAFLSFTSFFYLFLGNAILLHYAVIAVHPIILMPTIKHLVYWFDAYSVSTATSSL